MTLGFSASRTLRNQYLMFIRSQSMVFYYNRQDGIKQWWDHFKNRDNGYLQEQLLVSSAEIQLHRGLKTQNSHSCAHTHVQFLPAMDSPDTYCVFPCICDWINPCRNDYLSRNQDSGLFGVYSLGRDGRHGEREFYNGSKMGDFAARFLWH